MCPPMWAQWRHLANTIELVLPSANQSPQPKRQIDRFSHFCTAHGRKFLYFIMGEPFPQNCPFPWGIWSPISFMIPWACPRSQSKRHDDQFSHFSHRWPQSVPILHSGRPLPQNSLSHGGAGPPFNTIPWAYSSSQPKQHLDRFSRFCTDDHIVSLYFAMGRPFFLSKLPLPMGQSGSHLIHGSLGPPYQSPQPKRHLDRFSRFCRAHQCDRLTDRQTDRPRFSVGNNRPHLRT